MELDEKSGAVVVDKASRTSVPNIWAIGDVTNRLNLTPVALMEGMAFAANAFGGDSNAIPDYKDVASAVFSSPPLSHVGLSEEAAIEQFGDVDIYTSGFRCSCNIAMSCRLPAMLQAAAHLSRLDVIGTQRVAFAS